MRLSRTRRMWTAWMASLLILLSSLAPALSHAMVLQQTQGLQQALLDRLVQAEICHNAESDQERLSLPPVGQGGQHEPRAPMEHCPFCLTHAVAQALPSSGQGLTLLPPAVGSSLPPASLVRLPPPPAWRLALSRAPPAIL